MKKQLLLEKPVLVKLKFMQIDETLESRMLKLKFYLTSQIFPYFQASVENLFDSSHFWMIMENNNAKEDQTNHLENDTLLNFNKTERETNISSEILNILSNLNLSVDANIALATENINDNSYDLYDIYNFGKVLGGRINVVPMGKWSEDAGTNTDTNWHEPKIKDLITQTQLLSNQVYKCG